MEIIAYIETDFNEKFGIPRQSGLVPELTGKIIMEPSYRTMEAFKGIEGFSHLWLLWQFQGVSREHWSATVKPPRLGGNKHMGVFATRSPFRPNPIGLSCVKLERIENDEKYGPVLYVSGIDLLNRTPIYDIKPYLPYADAYPDAKGGFGEQQFSHSLEVNCDEKLLQILPIEKQAAAIQLLKQDPRPAYHKDPKRRYGVSFAGFDIRFFVEENVLTVVEIKDMSER